MLSLPSGKGSTQKKKKEFAPLGSRKSYLPGIIAENLSNCIYSHLTLCMLLEISGGGGLHSFFSDISPENRTWHIMGISKDTTCMKSQNPNFLGNKK